MTHCIILSYVQVEPLLLAKQRGLESAEVSPDLGLTTVPVTLDAEGVTFPSGEQLTWQQLEKIKKSQTNCFVVENDEIRPVQVFSEYTNRMCSLLPTKRTPTMLIAGFTMHRIV